MVVLPLVTGIVRWDCNAIDATITTTTTIKFVAVVILDFSNSPQLLAAVYLSAVDGFARFSLFFFFWFSISKFVFYGILFISSLLKAFFSLLYLFIFLFLSYGIFSCVAIAKKY